MNRPLHYHYIFGGIMPVPVSNIAHVVVIAIALLAAPVDIMAQDDHYESVQPDSADLLPLAAALVQSADSLAKIWPGFWSHEQNFLLITPGGGILLIIDGEPPPDYTRLLGDAVPAVLTGRAFVRAGHLPGYGAGRFPGIYDVGNRSVYALPPMGSTFRKRLSFYIHEAFHFFQREGEAAWSGTPEDTIMGISPAAALTDESIVDDPQFRRGLEKEDSLLYRIAGENNLELLIDLLHRYMEIRAGRVEGRPDVLAIERRYERREGTAEYVGCRAAAVAAGAPDALIECLTERLGEANPDDPIIQFLRWRVYSSGAVLCLALDRLEVTGWKDAVTRGDHLDQIIECSLGISILK